VLSLGQLLEIHHRDVIRTQKWNSKWTGVCQHMQQRTMMLKDYLPQWNKPIRILSSWGDNVYGYDFNSEIWRKANHKLIGIGRCVEHFTLNNVDKRMFFCCCLICLIIVEWFFIEETDPVLGKLMTWFKVYFIW